MTARTREFNIPLLFVHYGGERLRGSERVLLDLIAGLPPTYRPIVWCNSTTIADQVRHLGATVHVSRMSILLYYKKPHFDLPNYIRLVRTGLGLIRDHGVRLVHANSAAPAQWMVPASRRLKVPLLVHLHIPYPARDRNVLLLQHASALVGCSRAAIEGFQEDGVSPERIRVIHNGVDPSRLDDGDAKTLRVELGIAPNEVVAVAVSALVPMKGHDVLFAAIRRLADSGSGRVPHFLIVGDGPRREELLQLAEKLRIHHWLHFLGERQDVGAILRDVADILVLSSRTEGLPLAVAEGAIMGVPTVATAVGGVPEMVTHGRTGLLVPPEDPEALANAIADLTANAQLRVAMGSAAREHAKSYLTVQRVATEFDQLYSEMLSGSKVTSAGHFPPLSLRPTYRFVGNALMRRIAVMRDALRARRQVGRRDG